jgi:hypothetical protein
LHLGAQSSGYSIRLHGSFPLRHQFLDAGKSVSATWKYHQNFKGALTPGLRRAEVASATQAGEGSVGIHVSPVSL